MASRRKERIATGSVGAGMIASSGVLRHKGTEMNHKIAGVPEPKLGPLKFKSLQHYRKLGVAGRKGRALFAGGTALGLLGAPAVATAVTNTVPARQGRVQKASDSKPDFLGAGLQGTKDAVHGRASNLREKKPARAVGTSYGVGAVAALGGSLATHQAFDARDKARLARGLGRTALRHPATAVAGAVAGAASIPVTNRVMRHTAPGYVVTPSGVKRAKTRPQRPSSKSTSFEGRSSRGANQAVFRHQVVGKGYYWSQAADDRAAHRDSMFFSADHNFKGKGPVRRDGRYVEAVSHESESARPGVRRGGAKYEGKIPLRNGKAWAKKTQHWMEFANKESGHTGKVANIERDLLKARRTYIGSRAAGGAALIGAGYLVGRNHNVHKLFDSKTAPGMDREQTLRQIKAKRRKLTTDTATTGLGLAGVGLLAARHVPKIAAKHPNLERHALGTAIASGGVGAIGGVQGIRITRRDLHAQEKDLHVKKDLVMPYFPPKHEGKPTLNMVVKAAWGPQLPAGTLKAVAPRQSYLKTVRAPGGILKPVRVKAAMG